MKSSKVKVDKDETLFVSEHAVQTVTNKIKKFKKANENIHTCFSKVQIQFL